MPKNTSKKQEPGLKLEAAAIFEMQEGGFEPPKALSHQTIPTVFLQTVCLQKGFLNLAKSTAIRLLQNEKPVFLASNCSSGRFFNFLLCQSQNRLCGLVENLVVFEKF